MKRSHLIPAICLLAAACVTQGDDPEYVGIARVGDAVPAFEVTLSDGTPFVSPRDFLGRETDVVFFSTTCPDCQVYLRRLQEEWDGSTELLCISRAESAADVAAYWEAERLTLPYAAVPDRSVYNLFARSGIPRLYTISPSGVISRQLVISNV